MFLVRSALSYVLFFLALPILIAHPKLRRGYRQRLGLYRTREIPRGNGPRVWMHGASAGDVLALMPTVRALASLRPDVQVVMSTTTNTGRAMADRFGNELASVVYQPYDVYGSVTRALRRLQPDVLVLEYTELWPELIRCAARRGVRLALHNGRFSEQRLNRYQLLFGLVGNLLNCFSALLMRDQKAAEHARMLGASAELPRVTGNTKFDNLTSTLDSAKVATLRTEIQFTEGSLVLVAGSTHDGEVEPLLQIFARLRQHVKRLHLVIAPRYVDRANKIEQTCEKLGLTSHRRSVGSSKLASVVILDTIGELASAYALADVAFVGGSFTGRGGQNILEPAAHGKPVVFGPYMENFTDSVTLLLGRGGIQATSFEQLERILRDLFSRGAHRVELGAMAQDMVKRASGAAQRNAKEIADLLI